MFLIMGKRISIIILFLIQHLYAIAQEVSGASRERRYFMPEDKIASTNSSIEIRANGDTVLISEYENVNNQNLGRVKLTKLYKGTPLLNNNWYLGTVMYKNAKPTRGTIAYNLLTSKVLFMVSAGQPAVEIKPDAFEINGCTFINLEDQFKKNAVGYFEKINEKEPFIFKKYSVYYVPTKVAQIQQSGYDVIGNNEFEGEYKKELLYFLGIDNHLLPIVSNKSLLRKAGVYKSKFQKILEEYNLELNKPADVEKFINQLRKQSN